MNLNNKKVLFIAPHFHTYHIDIINELELLGAQVTFFEEVFYNRVYTLVRDKLFSPMNKILDTLYFNRILKVIQRNEYDAFLLIRGGLIDMDFLQKIRHSSPNIHCYMYQWDSLVHNNYQLKIPFFDEL